MYSIQVVTIFFRKRRYLSYCFSDEKSQKDPTNIAMASPHAPHENTKRGPPTNKHISVRNMKAQIANLSCNENTGFKSEYHVRTSLLIVYFFKLDFHENMKIVVARYITMNIEQHIIDRTFLVVSSINV